MEKLKDEVISNIRACLISCKGKVPLRQLENDYRLLIGERIPYSKFGCKNIDDFVSKIPSLSVSKNSSGEWFVDAKASDKSNHITDMVNKQKNAKKRPPPKTVRFSSYSKAPQTTSWKPANINYKPRKFKTSQRTAAVSHNQLVTRSPVKQEAFSVRSRLVIPEYSTLKMSDPATTGRTAAVTNSNDKRQVIDSSCNSDNMQKVSKVSNMPISTSTSRLRTSNYVEHSTNSPVDLTTFANSLLHTSRKRITRMMSEVSLERDSGNSSPTSDAKILPPTDIILTDDPIADLKNIVECYKLGKVEVIHTVMKPKKRNAPTLYNCKLTVDGQTYLSYPNDFYNEKSAQDYCAKKALEEIVPKCTRKKSLLLSSSKDIKERIPPMLQAHFQGIWSWQIEADYIDKYMEQLPLNWLEIIDSCDCVAVERIQNRFVLRYCRPGTALQKGVNSTPAVPLDISIPSNTVQFGEGNQLFAQITCIMSLNEVWARQWDTDSFEAYNETIEMMEPYYTEEGHNHKAHEIKEGSYYVAKYDYNWYRVRALDIRDTSVNCFLIDFGDEFIIEKQNIYNIRREFAAIQAQAFVCRLAGLEDLYDANIPLEKLSSYIGKEVILEASQTDTDDPDDQSIPVVMYDFTSGKSINEELLQFLTIEIAQPIIKPLTIQEVFVSHLTDDGYVYVQIHSKGFASLRTLLEYLETEIEENPPQCKEQITKTSWSLNEDRLFLMKHKKDGHWYRTKILDMSPKGDMAQVYFIDRGDFEVITIASEVMFPLDKISDVLHQFPAQAVRIRMALEVIPPNFVELASKLMKVDAPVLLKIVELGRNKDQLGEFYKRSADEGLFCINKSIMMETEINSKTNEDSALRGTRQKLVKLTQLKDEALLNVPSGGSLLRPKLPEKGEYLEVNIPFTVNPWNFFVQPYASKDELDNMMAALQERYSTATFSPLHISMILPGQIYATQHTDGIWYRTSVLKVIHSGSISVFYCDFGYYSSLSLNQLIPLDPEFTELPYQALKAKLSGIKPKKNKWSMEDCEFFAELVKGKSFVSVLMDIEKDELYESDPVLKLTLVDTSTEEDIFIDRELVKKNIAIKAD